MKNNKKTPFLIKLIKKLAPKIGARVVVEPEWKVAAQIIYKNGVVRSLRMHSLDLNHIASSDIARDKDYAKFFMEEKGYPVAEGETFFKDDWAKIVKSNRTISHASKYAEKLGYPVIVKPNSKSQGVDVSLVQNKKELNQALRKVFKGDRVAIIERYLSGKDYRLVVLDKKVISAYERIPLNVLGDGRSTIWRLLKIKQKQFVASSRDTQIKTDDPRIVIKLKHQGLSFQSVVAEGEKIYLLDNANLSTGGDAVDVTEKVHPVFRELAVKLTRDMGLRLCGVDLMIEGDISQKPNVYWVLEINSAPGLDHYAKIGKAQEKIVEDLYFEVLKHMER